MRISAVWLYSNQSIHLVYQFYLNYSSKCECKKRINNCINYCLNLIYLFAINSDLTIV